MSIVKILLRIIIFTIIYLSLNFIVFMIFEYWNDSINLANYKARIVKVLVDDLLLGVFPIFFFPLLFASMFLKYLKHKFSKIIYWVIAMVPILFYIYFSWFLIFFMGPNYENLIFLLLLFSIVLIFYYNYKLLLKV